MAETFAHGYAVVIGVDDNQVKRLTLPAVEKDVTAVYDVLVHPERCAYIPENVRLLKGTDSTRNNILEAFLWLKDKIKADENATAVVYYSGHGYRDKKANRYYLIPYDISSLKKVRIEALTAEEVQASIMDILAKRNLIILDCCHAEGIKAKDIDPDAPELETYAFPELPEIKEIPTYDPDRKAVSKLAQGAGRAVLNSSTGPESSYVRPDQKMSVFTYHLIEAMTGHAPHKDEDTTILVTDVMSWVTRRVSETAAAINKSQTPVMRTEGVFPIAQLIGGEGLAKGIAAPDPLEPLPEVGVSAVINQQGQIVGGNQINAAIIEGDVVQGNQTVHTEVTYGDRVGGNVIHGNQTTIGTVSGGAIAIGPNARATNTKVEGDQFNMSGDFRGAILNIKSSLQDVTQSIGAIPYAQTEEKEQLADLIYQMERTLQEAIEQQDAPPELPDDAEKIVKRIKAMIEEANDDNPDQEMIETWGDRVKRQAGEIGKFLPAVLPLATQIVEHVLQILPQAI